MTIPEGLIKVQIAGRDAVSAAEVSRALQRSEGWIRAAIHDGAVEGVQVGRGWFVYCDSLAAWSPQRGRPPKVKEEQQP